MPDYLPIDPIIANNSDNPSALISCLKQLKLKFKFCVFPPCLRGSLTFDDAVARLGRENPGLGVFVEAFVGETHQKLMTV